MLPLPVGTTGTDTLRRSCDDTVFGLGVPPVVPFNRTLCPASPSLQWVPWVSVPHLAGLGIHCNHGPRYYDPLRLPNVHLRFVRSSLSSPDTLYRPSLLFVSLLEQTRWWAELSSSTPGFRYRWISYYRHFTQGNIWISQVPRLPPWPHALASDPGGVLTTRHTASRTAAFRHHNNVGFHSRFPGKCPMTTMSKISGLHTQPAALIHPASDSRYRVCPRISLLTCWLNFNQVGLFQFNIGSTHWVTISNFMNFVQSRQSGFSLARCDFLS